MILNRAFVVAKFRLILSTKTNHPCFTQSQNKHNYMPATTVWRLEDILIAGGENKHRFYPHKLNMWNAKYSH